MQNQNTTRLLGAGLLALSLCACGQSSAEEPEVGIAPASVNDVSETIERSEQQTPTHDPALEMTGTREQGYAVGRAEAIADWENGQAVIYQIGEPTSSYFNAETGLNIEAIAGCCVTPYILGRHAGYNEYINAQIEAHGLPEYNRLQWAQDFTYPNRAFSNFNTIHRLAPDSEPISGPGGLEVQWVTELGDTTQMYLVLLQADGQERNRIAWSSQPYDNPTTFVWGPEGSDVLYIQMDTPDDDAFGDIFFTYDLRTGLTLGYRRGTDQY